MTPHSEPVDYIELTRARYEALEYPAYQWVENLDPAPLAPLAKPLSQCRVSLIGSGGIYLPGQTAFHYKDDISYRIIDSSTDTDALRATHFAYDLSSARTDANTVFPLRTLRRLVDSGEIGALTKNALAFMGGIYSIRKMRDWLAPALADHVQSEGADVVILVPA